MQNRRVVGVLVGVALALSAGTLLAQDTPVLVLATDQHVKPGMTAKWEDARKQHVAFLAEHDFPYQDIIWVSDQGVYRSNVLLDGWNGIERRQQWAATNDLFGQAFWRSLVDATDHRDDLIVWPRQELNYTPSNPLLAQDDVGFIRERRYYLRPGTGRESREVREAMLAIHQEHDIRSGYFVGRQVAGPDAPRMFVFMPRRDVTDWFTQAAANTEVMGDEVRELRVQMNALARKAEWIHWTPRPDLSYTPAGQ